jgi:hypothetical protein
MFQIALRGKNFFRLLTAGLFLLCAIIAHAQNPSVLSTVSPYSRYGLGDFQFNGSLINTAMGGGGIGLRNDSLIPQYINLANPASLTSHPLVNYEIGISSNTVKVENTSANSTFNRTTLSHFALAFPVTKTWGAAFGLIPYTSVGYNVAQDSTVENLGAVQYRYEGSGGISQAFISNAIRPFGGLPRRFVLSSRYDELRALGDTSTIKAKMKLRNNLANISVGVNVSYLFGSLINIRRDVFPDSLNTFNTKITKYTSFKDVYATAGIQYTFRFPRTLNPQYIALPDTIVTNTKLFGNKYYYRTATGIDTAKLFIKQPGARVTFGAVFAAPMDINISYDLTAVTYKQLGTIENVKDTIVLNSAVPGRVSLPMMGGIGFAIKKDFKWMFQADYTMQMWKDYRYLGTDVHLKNSQRVTMGFQFQPKQAGRGNILGATQYRFGARYYQTYLELNNTRLNEMSVNFGMAFPLPYRTRLGEPISRVSLNIEAGQRGTTDAGLLKESFIRATVGLTINDRWFVRYKLD